MLANQSTPSISPFLCVHDNTQKRERPADLIHHVDDVRWTHSGCVCVCVWRGGVRGEGATTSNSVDNEDLGMIEPPSEPLRYWSIL